jgi:hypothetical protein
MFISFYLSMYIDRLFPSRLWKRLVCPLRWLQHCHSIVNDLRYLFFLMYFFQTSSQSQCFVSLQAALTAIRCLERSNVELLPLLGKYAHKLFAEVLSILSGADLINEAVQSACWKLVRVFSSEKFYRIFFFFMYVCILSRWQLFNRPCFKRCSRFNRIPI